MEINIPGTFELLTEEEWDKYLGLDMFDKMRIDISKFVVYQERIMLYPLIQQSVAAQNNKVGSLNITYALCRHYYDKGIPDDPWYKSPGDNGESIQYMPNFKKEHWMRRYWFNHFAESIYLKLFSTWDSIIDFIAVFYNLDFEHNLSFKPKVLKWLKSNKPEIGDYYDSEIINSSMYTQASTYRNDFTHNIAPSEISNGFVLKKNELVDYYVKDKDGKFMVDDNGQLIIEKRRATVLSCRAGDYTNVKTIMDNIDAFIEFSGNRITELIDMIVQ